MQGSITVKRFLSLQTALAGVPSSIVLAQTNSLIGIRIEFLPPYSPDLNPIEEAFSKIKAFLHRNRLDLTREGDGMIFELMEVMKVVTGDDAIGYFIHGGYF